MHTIRNLLYLALPLDMLYQAIVRVMNLSLRVELIPRYVQRVRNE